MISRALFYDMLDKANLHSTYKGLLGSIGAPSKGLKSVSRLVMEKSKPPWPLGGPLGTLSRVSAPGRRAEPPGAPEGSIGHSLPAQS